MTISEAVAWVCAAPNSPRSSRTATTASGKEHSTTVAGTRNSRVASSPLRITAAWALWSSSFQLEENCGNSTDSTDMAYRVSGIVTIRNANDSMVMLPSSRNEANIRSASMQACCAPAASRMGAKARPNWLPWPFSSGIASPRR